MTDIVDRLLIAAPMGLSAAHVSDLAALREAADEIERLRRLVDCKQHIERDACAKIADDAESEANRIALLHQEDSASRDRMFARAREACGIAAAIRNRQ